MMGDRAQDLVVIVTNHADLLSNSKLVASLYIALYSFVQMPRKFCCYISVGE